MSSKDQEKVNINEMTVDQLFDLNQKLTDDRAEIRKLQTVIMFRIDVLTIAADMAKKHKINPDLDEITKMVEKSRAMAAKKKTTDKGE